MMHRFWYRVSGGRIGGNVGKAPVLLLTTTGRKTGKRRHDARAVPAADDDCLVVVASNAGDTKNPAWWTNLKANPDGHVLIRNESYAITARLATADERTRLWPRLVEMYPTYDDYTEAYGATRASSRRLGAQSVSILATLRAATTKQRNRDTWTTEIGGYTARAVRVRPHVSRRVRGTRSTGEPRPTSDLRAPSPTEFTRQDGQAVDRVVARSVPGTRRRRD